MTRTSYLKQSKKQQKLSPFSELKIIVAGSRDFDDYSLLKQKLDFYCQKYSSSQIEIVSGTAKGADRLGERYARERELIRNLKVAQNG